MNKPPKRKKLYVDEDGLQHKSHPDEPVVKADKEERAYWKVMELMPTGTNYSPYERMDAIAAYAETGAPRKVAALTGIPYQTIITWRKSPWWRKGLIEVRKMDDDKLDARLTRVMHKSIEQMEDRLEKGDEVITKDGDKVRQKVKFRDLAVAGVGVTFDKRALTRGEPTARVDRTTDDARFKKLQDQFKKIAQGRTIVIPSNHIEQVENDPIEVENTNEE